MKLLLVPVSLISLWFSPVILANNSGFIDYIDNANSYIVIRDKSYKMALNLKVTDKKDARLNRYALKVGYRVAFKLSQSQNPESAKKVLTHIKILNRDGEG
jgi:hypothetical protein